MTDRFVAYWTDAIQATRDELARRPDLAEMLSAELRRLQANLDIALQSQGWLPRAA